MQNPTIELKSVAPEQARFWLDHCNYELQRKMAPWHVARLAREIEKKRLIAGTQIHFAKLGDALKLVDGQHTLAAICRAAVPVSLTVLITPVETQDEIGALYARHGRSRGRTPADAFKALGLSQKLGLEDPEINILGAAIRYVANGFQRPVVGNTNDDTAELATSLDTVSDKMLEWGFEAGLFFEKARQAKHGMKSRYMRAPVLAVALPTFRHQPDRAHDFWGGAVEDDSLSNKDPRRLLNIYLLTHPSGHMDVVAYMRVVAAAWNAFHAGRQLAYLKAGDVGKVGVTIAGTPYEATLRQGRRSPSTVPTGQQVDEAVGDPVAIGSA